MDSESYDDINVDELIASCIAVEGDVSIDFVDKKENSRRS
jgi:hypothetical protein